MLLDILGITEDFEKSYGFCEELANNTMQPNLPKHYAIYFCPSCFFANYVDANFSYNAIECCQCNYKGNIPGVDCRFVTYRGLARLPTQKECGCPICIYEHPVRPDEIALRNLVYGSTTGVEKNLEPTITIKLGPINKEKPVWARPINKEKLSKLPKFKLENFEIYTEEEPTPEYQNIFAAILKAAERVESEKRATDIADIQKQIAIVANDPTTTYRSASHWTNPECNDAGDMFDHLKTNQLD